MSSLMNVAQFRDLSNNCFKKDSKSQWWIHKSAKFNLPGMKYHSFIYDLWIGFYLINAMDDIRWKFLGFFYMLRYFNFESSFKLRWWGARDLFGSQIPVTTGGFELRISCMQSSYLTLLGLVGLGNYFACKRFAVQTLLWSQDFVIQTNLEHVAIAVFICCFSYIAKQFESHSKENLTSTETGLF